MSLGVRQPAPSGKPPRPLLWPWGAHHPTIPKREVTR